MSRRGRWSPIKRDISTISSVTGSARRPAARAASRHTCAARMAEPARKRNGCLDHVQPDRSGMLAVERYARCG